MPKFKKRQGKMESAGAVLARWLGRYKKPEDLKQYVILNRWDELVGDHLAGKTSPLDLNHGVLTIGVISSAWLNELTFMREEIIKRINEFLKEKCVTRIQMVVRNLTPISPRTRAEAEISSYVEVPPETEEEIDRIVAQVSDDDLKSAIKQAQRAHAVRMLRHRGG